jgi:hypothetical protein
MKDATTALEAAIAEVERCRRVLKKMKAPQVRSSDERALAKATASAWFASHRPRVDGIVSTESVDEPYGKILEASERHSSRTKYIALLSDIKAELIKLRTASITAKPNTATTSDQAPDFSALIADPAMQAILVSRWEECIRCLNVQASLAATVMMGGLLEALLLARVNREGNKSSLFTARTAPKAAKTGGAKPLNEWMLNDFIQVLSELKWITVSAGAVGAVLRDYRNYIHPQKQLSHNMHLTPQDAALFWEVTKNITRQLVM